MATLEVQANMAFGDWRRGEKRQVDGDDPAVQGLVFGRYLTVVNVLPEPAVPVVKKRKPRVRTEDPSGTSGDLSAAVDPGSTESSDPAGQ